MFPHTVTIFNVIQKPDKTIYHRCVVSDVYHYETQSISDEGKGEKISSIYNVVFSSDAIKKYVEKIQEDDNESVFSLKDNDIVVYGEFQAIDDSLSRHHYIL